MTADDIIDALGLMPHPEGGWFREIIRAPDPDGGRDAYTVIHFLLKAGARSHWHKVDAVEQWFHLAGAPLVVAISADDTGPAVEHRIRPLADAPGQQQALVPAHHWQSAWSEGDYTLVSCTVAPGFRFEGFELAPPAFDIPVG
ncbi:cupin domain-containing protein [Maritimibacter dapengensis]|uniref:Cupin domain-containing protein n=1 Tax=Maritimibacter dapengensis TaxID=2836868 RepID=A0ABS6T1C0_9RHOB|nr:cupin domain-containing protein [Maritimibacter dapengensis]MBV7378391.1 cupin domain-containing protein [Maritimibacter dapengensis]